MKRRKRKKREEREEVRKGKRKKNFPPQLQRREGGESGWRVERGRREGEERGCGWDVMGNWQLLHWKVLHLGCSK